jgi:hypothetical protein
VNNSLIKMKKFHFDVIQLISSFLGAIFGGIAGLLIGMVSMANVGLVVGYLPGYEAGGVLGGAAGVWIGSILGLLLAAKLSHTDKEGSLILCVLFSLVGAVVLLAGMGWMIPGLNSPAPLLLVAALAYVGWNLPHWLRGRA